MVGSEGDMRLKQVEIVLAVTGAQPPGPLTFNHDQNALNGDDKTKRCNKETSDDTTI